MHSGSALLVKMKTKLRAEMHHNDDISTCEHLNTKWSTTYSFYQHAKENVSE